jgi:Tfp pilus assembly PilM family ATPase
VTGLVDLLKLKFKMPVEYLNPFNRIAIGKGVDVGKLESISPSMAIAVGLALRSFDSE